MANRADGAAAPDPGAPRARLPATVVALGVVSLLTDFSSEMIYPLLPAFLLTLGASGAFIGAIDGVADTTSALVKLASGLWADRVRRKKPLVALGYGLASLARPLVALAQVPWHVLGIRFTDRIGKGIRTSPRDALIAEVTPAERRGAAYGFHRAMDNTGSLVGPLVAFALASWLGLPYRTIFLVAAVPGLFAFVALLVGVREEAAPRPTPARALESPSASPASPVRLPARLKAYLVVLAIFTLGNSSDFFLLLRAKDAGIPASYAPLLWAALSAVKSLLSMPFGRLSDEIGRKRVIAAGWLVYALVYLGFAHATTALHVWLLLVVYGVYYALVEGAEKALVADLAPVGARGRAFGWFNFLVGVTVLPASILFGLIWDRVGHAAAFTTGAAIAGVATLGLFLIAAPPRHNP